MRNASIAVLREIGVETGGSNVQFAVNPDDGRLVVIEMNPRVSRSSALASKATGFPIAKVAAKLAVGYTLDELANDITGGATPASFEPTIDYVVTKIPRFAFEKFPGAEPTLTTAMKSVGEVMAIGRTFQESLQKALRCLETGLTGLDEIEIAGARRRRRQERHPRRARHADARPAAARSRRPCAWAATVDEIHDVLQDTILVPAPDRGHRADRGEDPRSAACRRTPANLRQLKAMGFSDAAAGRARRPDRGRGAQPSPRARTCARSSSASTPAPPNSPRPPPTCIRPTRRRSPASRDEAQPSDRQEGRHPRRRAQPHRPGHRVRLLLLPRLLRAARRGLRDRSWSTATRRRSRPTTTPPTASISSR